jgi:glycine oxidase
MLRSDRCAIVGAGIMGTLVAEKLFSSGWDVTVYERESLDKSGACSMTAAAMLAPYCELDVSDPLVMEIGRQSLESWPLLIDEYAPDIFFRSLGSVVVAHPQEQQELERFYRRIERHVSGVCQKLTVQELHHFEPQLGGTFDGGLAVAGEAQVDGSAFLRSLQKELIKRGVRFIDEVFIEDIGNQRVGNETYDWVIDCRGLAAKDEIKELRGVRGEILEVKASEVRIDRPVRVMHPRYPLYIVPRPNHRYLIGATVIESLSDKPVTVRSALELLSTTFCVHPGFAESHIMNFNVGVRPAFCDNLPRVYLDNRCICINGLYRHGFLLAPTLADWVAQIINKSNCSQIHPNIFMEKACK